MVLMSPIHHRRANVASFVLRIRANCIFVCKIHKVGIVHGDNIYLAYLDVPLQLFHVSN